MVVKPDTLMTIMPPPAPTVPEKYVLVRFLGWSLHWAEWVPATQIRRPGSVVRDMEFEGKVWGWCRRGDELRISMCDASTRNRIPATDILVTDVTTFLLDPCKGTARRVVDAVRLV